MKSRKFFVILAVILCLAFFLFLPFYFGIQFLLPSMTEEEESSEVSVDVLTPDECSPLEAWKLCEAALAAEGNFSTFTEGATDTQILFFNYRQQINNKRVVTEESVFSQSMNTGALLNAGLQQYFDGSKAYLRPCHLVGSNHLSWAETPSAVTMTAYFDAFGPVNDGLSAFLLNERTLTTGFYLHENDGIYTFSYVLSEEAAVYYAKSLRALCQLEETPAFTSIEIKLEMDENFRPLRAEYEEEYKITMDLIGETVCKSRYVETFAYEEQSVPQQEYFAQFSDLSAETTVPALSTGYNFLFSLFGNTNSYDATLTFSGEEIPLLISLDTSNESIYAVGESFSFAFADGSYYFDVYDNKLRSGSNAFNDKLLPLMPAGTVTADNSNGNAVSDSFMDGVSIKNEQGKLIISSSSQEMSFSVTVDTTTMIVEKLSVELSISGEKGTLSMVQSNTRGEMPSLSGYTDVSRALDSLDILLELSQQNNTYYNVKLEGEQSLEADVMLTLGENVSIYAVPKTDDFPVELFIKDDFLTAVYNDISVTGSLGEFEALLACLSNGNSPATMRTAVSDDASDFRVTVSGNRIVLLFGDDFTQKITFGGDHCIYNDGTTSVRITKTGHGSEAAKSAPKTKHILAATELTTFLDGSVYPQLLAAKTIYAALEVSASDQQFDVDAVLSMGSELIIQMNTMLYEEPVDLYYKNDNLFLCHDAFKAFVAADKLDKVASSFRFSTGTEGTPVAFNATSRPSTTEDELKSITVEPHQIILVFAKQTIRLTKDGFRLEGEDTTIQSRSLRGGAEAVSLSVPSVGECIDLEDLATKLDHLNAQSDFAFTGNYTNGVLNVMISRLDFQLSADKAIEKMVAEAVVGSSFSQLVKLHYDGDLIYLDVSGIKVFSTVEAFRNTSNAVPVSQTFKESAGDFDNLFGEEQLIDVSRIKSITYKNETLVITTEDATVSIAWNGDRLDLIRYESGLTRLLLASCEQRPMNMPSADEYYDFSSLAGLFNAALNTYNSNSFRFDGKIDLKIFSHTLENVSASGIVSFENDSLFADVYFTVPYVSGVSSVNIPQVHNNKLLKDCTIVNRVIIHNDTLYIKKEIYGEYGSYPAEILVLTEKRFVALDEFAKDPTKALTFIFNLESDLSPNDPPELPPETDPDSGPGEDTPPDPIFSQTPFESVYKEGDYYIIEISPDYLPGNGDRLYFAIFTDDLYINQLKAVANVSMFTIEASANLYDHGDVAIRIPAEDDLSEYLPLLA